LAIGIPQCDLFGRFFSIKVSTAIISIHLILKNGGAAVQPADCAIW
jgi:hypothetical protein